MSVDFKYSLLLPFFRFLIKEKWSMFQIHILKV